jgi:hypothetical protein
MYYDAVPRLARDVAFAQPGRTELSIRDLKNVAYLLFFFADFTTEP